MKATIKDNVLHITRVPATVEPFASGRFLIPAEALKETTTRGTGCVDCARRDQWRALSDHWAGRPYPGGDCQKLAATGKVSFDSANPYQRFAGRRGSGKWDLPASGKRILFVPTMENNIRKASDQGHANHGWLDNHQQLLLN